MTNPSSDEIDRLLSDPTIQAESPQREIIATLRSLTDTWRHYVPRNDAEETALGALFNSNAVQIQGTRRKPYARLTITGSRWKEMLEKASDSDQPKVVYMILKLVWEYNPESEPANKVVEPKEFERLLADLEKLSSQCPKYTGTVEKCIEGVGLRYFRREDFDLIVDKTDAEEWNLAVGELNRIAKRVIQIIEHRQEILTPDYITPGAAVMAWVLRDNWPKNRVSATCIGNAFSTIRDRLIQDRLIQDCKIEGSKGEVASVKSISVKVPLHDDDVHVAELAKLKLDAQSNQRTNRPDANYNDHSPQDSVDTTKETTRKPYKWMEFLAEDAWIYENIHSNSFDDLRVDHNEQCQSKKHFKKVLVRNQYKTRADRYADYHTFPKRRFKGACECPDCQPVTDTPLTSD